MSVKVEKLEKNMAKIIVEVEASVFDKALVSAYNKNKGKYNLPGFRKGKAPMNMIEKAYGPQVFFEDAVDEVLDATYPEAMKESGLEIVSRPEIAIDQIGKGQNLVYTATVAVKPEVTLGEYKGVTVTKAEAKVSAADVKAELDKVLEQNARIVEVDRKIKKNDIATIDFNGFVDGKEFPGGKGEDYPLTIGSGTFIPGFEDQLIGKKTGEEVDVNVTFPAEYGAKDLAGKDATFKVTIKQVKEKQVPKADDEFASEVSEFETLAEYKEDIKKKLKEQKEKQAAVANENAVIDAVVANASMEIPDAMVEGQVLNMLNDYAMRLQQQGIPIDQYLQITGQTAETLKDQMRPSALRNIKTRLVLEAVCEKENISATDEQVEAEFAKIAEQYKMPVEDLMKNVGENEKNQMRKDLALQATIDMLVAEAKLVAAKKEKKEDEE